MTIIFNEALAHYRWSQSINPLNRFFSAQSAVCNVAQKCNKINHTTIIFSLNSKKIIGILNVDIIKFEFLIWFLSHFPIIFPTVVLVQECWQVKLTTFQMWSQSSAVGSVQTPPPTMTLTFFALAMHEHLLARNTSLLSSHQSLEKTGADYFSKLYLSLSPSSQQGWGGLQTRALSSPLLLEKWMQNRCLPGPLSTNYRFICSNFLIFFRALLDS